jgi:LysM repeat protein
MLAIISTGCLRSASSGDAEIPQGLERSTNTPFPSPTSIPPTPTEEPPTLEPQATLPPVEVGTGGQATDVFGAQDTGLPSDEGIQQPSTDQGIQQLAQPTATLSDLLIQATQIIQQATQQALDQTATAMGPQISLPTFTPTIDPFATVSPFATPTSGVVLTGGDCIHEVSAGENLFRLSLRYGVLVNDIARASGVTNVNLISVGQKLTIPGCGTTGVFPPPTSIPAVSTGTTGTTTVITPVPSAGGVTHIVQQGETLFELSLQYGVPVNTIAAANGIVDVNRIFLNQELIIP